MQGKYWEDVLTSHAEDAAGRTWRVQEKRMGSSIFEVDEGVVQVSLQLHMAQARGVG